MIQTGCVVKYDMENTNHLTGICRARGGGGGGGGGGGRGGGGGGGGGGQW